MIRRTYRCDECNNSFESFHQRRDEPAPECPVCAGESQHDAQAEFEAGEARIRAMAEEGKAPGVLTNKSRAIDLTQKIAERDYGLTDMKTGTREGESIIMGPPPIQTAQREKEIRELVAAGMPAPVTPEQQAGVNQFWRTGGAPAAGSGFAPPIAAPQNIYQQTINTAVSTVTTGAARATGPDPMKMLHDAAKSGEIKTKYISVADANG